MWNDLSSNEGATGGGVSGFFALPTYQQTAGVPKSPSGFVGRGVPDVAGDADPETGYNVVVDGSATVIGGTSAVAPLWAGLLARINQSLGKDVGYVNPLLYASESAATFHDITSGTNGTYSAGPGWDACTGLGSPDGCSAARIAWGQGEQQVCVIRRREGVRYMKRINVETSLRLREQLDEIYRAWRRRRAL